MKRPLKVSERVACYSNGHRYVGIVDDIRGNTVWVDTPQVSDFLNPLEAHPRQCRRLVPKRPRRKLYAVVPSYGVMSVVAYYNLEDAQKAANARMDVATVQTFVEARPKKKESK